MEIDSKDPDDTLRSKVTDIIGNTIENILSFRIMMESEPDELNHFSVSHGLQVDDEEYKYLLVAGKEGSDVYEEIEKLREQIAGIE